jgi:AmmeMemoRadiSam system protein A
MYQPKSPYTEIALKTIIHYLEYGNIRSLEIDGIPEEIYEIKRGCFVTLHKTGGELRGCIGTIEPREDNLVQEIMLNAVSAAMNDSRFQPLLTEELDEIEVSVDVLTEPEPVYDLADLDPAIYGLILSDSRFRRGILLPGLEGVETVEKQIDIVRRKAGLEQESLDALEIYRFTSNRYH